MPGCMGGSECEANHKNRSKLIACYYTDHDALEARLESWKKMLANDEWNEEAWTQTEEFVAFLHKELEHHLYEEEQILFPALAEALDSSVPIAVMQSEHETLRQTITRLREEVDVCRTRRTKTAELMFLIREIDALLCEHIYKENNVLFPMADQILSHAQKERLLAQLHACRR